MERTFLEQRAQALRSVSTTVFLVVGIIMLLGVTWRVVGCAWLDRDTFPSDTAWRNHLTVLLARGTIAIWLLALVAILRCRSLKRFLSSSTVEGMIVTAIILMMSAGVLAQPVTIARMQGIDRQYNMSDSRLWLVISTCHTVTHVGLPLRFSALVPVTVAGIALGVTLVAGLGVEPTDSSVVNLVFLTFMLTASLVGKRNMETEDRQSFLSLLHEKSRRCTAEFRLARSGQSDQPLLPTDAASHARSWPTDASVPTDTPSGVIFDALLDSDADLTSKLTQLAAMGDTEHWRVKEADTSIMANNILGEGGFGRVHCGLYCGMVVAIKMLKHAPEKLADLCNELRVLRRLRHPHIAAMHGAVIDPQTHKIALVLEFIRGATLHAFLLGGAAVGSGIECTVSSRFAAMFGICRALLYMHTRDVPVIHGDLKASNVMMTLSQGGVQPKLLDFGLSRVLTKTARCLGGSVHWMAPEVMMNTGLVKCSADLYSFGRLLAFIASSVPPTSLRDREGYLSLFRQGIIPPVTWPDNCVFRRGCEPLVDACLRFGELLRPKIPEVLQGLCRLPQELGLTTAGGYLLEEARLLAAHPSPPRADGAVPPEPPAGAGSEPLHAAGLVPPFAEGLEAPVPARPLPSEAARRAEAVEGRLPTLPEDAPLEAEAPAAPRGPGPHGAPWRRFPRMPETSESARLDSLLRTFMRWNFELPRARCCELHAAFEVISGLRREVRAMPCGPLRQRQGQCANCGILGLEDAERCDLCGKVVSEGGPADGVPARAVASL